MKTQNLNKRERQILDILYELEEASVQEVYERIEDAPSYNAIRVTMYLLENKGYLTHRQKGTRYIFRATEAKKDVGSSALDHVLKIFFEGSVLNLVNTLIGSDSKKLSDKELNELMKLIEQKKKDNKNQDDE